MIPYRLLLDNFWKSIYLGMDTVGFLMMTSHTTPENLLEEVKKKESYGVGTIYVFDSAEALTINDTRRRMWLFKENLSTAVGFHGHNNFPLGVADSIVALEEGADRLDMSLAGMGACAGHSDRTSVFSTF